MLSEGTTPTQIAEILASGTFPILHEAIRAYDATTIGSVLSAPNHSDLVVAYRQPGRVPTLWAI